MLKQLTLKNFVLVESLDIDFNQGLTTITGESGAGKSILLNALGLLLGERARTEVIRPGTDKADVSAEFELERLPQVQQQLDQDELTGDDPARVLIRRVVSSQGRSRAFINGIPVTTGYLKNLGELLVDVHGQNEHLRLAQRSVQLSLLDDFATLAKPAADVAAAYTQWQRDEANIQRLSDELSSAVDRQDLLRYQLQELDEFAAQSGEFDTLAADHKRLHQAHETLASLQTTLERLDDLDALRQAVRQIELIDDDHRDLQSAQGNLEAAMGLLDDAGRDLRHYQDQVIIDPALLQEVETRLNTLQDLARKHRIQPNDLAEHTAKLHQELEDIDADGANLETLKEQAAAQQAAFHKKAKALSTKRRKAAPKFAKAVSEYMRQLGITQGALEVAFSDTEGEQGIDHIEFMVTTNPNFAPGPLTQIASGGEQTRIGLSIQIVAAQTSALPCLILDEADVGVGGTTADTVGRILRDLGSHTQVICITHAPQVAALGDNHYRVIKQGDHTEIHPLLDSHRIDELARMLAGADITDKTRSYAESLLSQAATESV